MRLVRFFRTRGIPAIPCARCGRPLPVEGWVTVDGRRVAACADCATDKRSAVRRIARKICKKGVDKQ